MLSTNRRTAILIMETVAEMMGKEKMFDRKWFEIEDVITQILDEGRKDDGRDKKAKRPS